MNVGPVHGLGQCQNRCGSFCRSQHSCQVSLIFRSFFSPGFYNLCIYFPSQPFLKVYFSLRGFCLFSQCWFPISIKASSTLRSANHSCRCSSGKLHLSEGPNPNQKLEPSTGFVTPGLQTLWKLATSPKRGAFHQSHNSNSRKGGQHIFQGLALEEMLCSSSTKLHNINIMGDATPGVKI